MLERPGDLIPVKPAAATIPWTRRRSQILNFLHRGPVNFNTLVYDTNVGDISSLASYFNEERISVDELNSRFGHNPFSETSLAEEETKIGNENVVMPRLLLYPERITAVQSEGNGFKAGTEQLQNQARVQRTLDWVMSQKLKAQLKTSGIHEIQDIHKIQDSSRSPEIDSNMSRNFSGAGRAMSTKPRDTMEASLPEPHPSISGSRWPPPASLNLDASVTEPNLNIKASATEPTDLAKALDVVARALCDQSWTENGQKLTLDW